MADAAAGAACCVRPSTNAGRPLPRSGRSRPAPTSLRSAWTRWGAGRRGRAPVYLNVALAPAPARRGPGARASGTQDAAGAGGPGHRRAPHRSRAGGHRRAGWRRQRDRAGGLVDAAQAHRTVPAAWPCSRATCTCACRPQRGAVGAADAEGVPTRGLSCASGALEPSHVLRAMGVPAGPARVDPPHPGTQHDRGRRRSDAVGVPGDRGRSDPWRAARLTDCSHACAGRDVGRGGFVGRRRLAARAGSRRRRRHDEALGRRVATRGAARSPMSTTPVGSPSSSASTTTSSTSPRSSTPRSSGPTSPRTRGAHAESVRRLQPSPEVRALPRSGPRGSASTRRHRPPRPGRGRQGTGPPAPWRRHRQGPVLRALDARPASSCADVVLADRRADQGRGAGGGGGPACARRTSPTARTSASSRARTEEAARGASSPSAWSCTAGRGGRSTDGDRVGAVDAVELVTVGQRRGLGLAGGGRRRTRSSVDVASATVIVGIGRGLARSVTLAARRGPGWIAARWARRHVAGARPAERPRPPAALRGVVTDAGLASASSSPSAGRARPGRRLLRRVDPTVVGAGIAA